MIVTLGEPMMVFNGPPGAPIALGTSMHATFAGAESSVAIGLSRLGHEVRLLSVLGDDAFGHSIARCLRGEGVDISGLQFSPKNPTGVMFKNRWPGDEPEVFYYRNTSAFSAAGAGTFDPSLWRDASLIYLTGITPALSPACLALFDQVLTDAQARNIPVWLDPNYRGKLWSPEAFAKTLAGFMPRIDTILPGLREGEILTGKTNVGEIACKLMGMGVKNVILKAGGQGAVAYAKDSTTRADAFALDRVIDPIGAGDAFATGYLSAHLDAIPIADCLKRAHAVAALVCMTHGDWEGLPTRRELDRFLSRRGEAHR